jgi:hypothetical protein
MGLSRRFAPLAAVAAAGCLLSSCGGSAAARDRTALHTSLARENADAVARSLGKARSALLSAAADPSFSAFVKSPDDRTTKVAGDPATKVAAAMLYMDSFFNSSGEVCFIDSGGGENARLVHGVRQSIEQLSEDESKNPFFAPTLAQKAGEVYIAAPYTSPDTHEGVLSVSTPIFDGSAAKAMLHVEVALAPFKTLLQTPDTTIEVQLVEATTGESILSTMHAPMMAPSGIGPYTALKSRAGAGTLVVGGRTLSYVEVDTKATGANHWFVVVGPSA